MSDESLESSTRRETLRLGGALVAGAVGAGLLAAQASAQQGPAPANGTTPGGLRVALVDIGVVFKGYKRKDALEKQVNAKKDQLEQQARAQAQIIESLRKKLDELKEGSQMWRDKRKELKLAIKQAEVMRDSMDEELKLEIENLTLMILDEIEETVREFGKNTGYDVVIKVDSKGWGDERFQERIFRAQVSSVLYYDPRLDVTPTVIQLLNDPARIQKYEQRSFGGGGAPSPAPQNPAPPQSPPPPGPTTNPQPPK